jgi:uroporphyrinogen-III synthase
MTDAALEGVGVLVTRPRTQAGDLVAAIEAAGGTAFCFPVLEIVAIDENVVVANASSLAKPDIVIFVSRNAVEYGLEYSDGAQIAAIGPATAAAIAAAGRIVDIQPAEGYDSEHLLAEPVLNDVDGKQIRIIRGSAGRELLAEELASRGAGIDYLSVYERRRPKASAQTLADLEARWRQGDIDVITAMSVHSFRNLVALLPAWCEAQLEITPLVTPAGRVLKEVLDRYPAARPILASGPRADEMVEAIIALRKADPALD